MKWYAEVYDKGVTRLEEEFDMLKYCHDMRDLASCKSWIHIMNHRLNPNDKCPFDNEANDSDE